MSTADEETPEDDELWPGESPGNRHPTIARIFEQAGKTAADKSERDFSYCMSTNTDYDDFWGEFYLGASTDGEAVPPKFGKFLGMVCLENTHGIERYMPETFAIAAARGWIDGRDAKFLEMAEDFIHAKDPLTLALYLNVQNIPARTLARISKALKEAANMYEGKQHKAWIQHVQRAQAMLDLHKPGKEAGTLRQLLGWAEWEDDSEVTTVLISRVARSGDSTDEAVFRQLAADWADTEEMLDFADLGAAATIWLEKSRVGAPGRVVRFLSGQRAAEKSLIRFLKKEDPTYLSNLGDEAWIELLAHENGDLRHAAIAASARRARPVDASQTPAPAGGDGGKTRKRAR